MEICSQISSFGALIEKTHLFACIEKLDRPRGDWGINTAMKARISSLLALIVLMVMSVGCYRTVDGHVKAGMPMKKDKIVSRYERPLADVFQSAKEVLAFNGTLRREDTINNTLESKIDTRTVRIKVIEEDPSLCQVIVQVRTKGGGSDIDLASEIDKQVALQLYSNSKK